MMHDRIPYDPIQGEAEGHM